MWLIGAVVCLSCCTAVQLFASADNGWPHNALRDHQLMPISCHFRDCKTLLVLSLTHVSSAIALSDLDLYPFTFTNLLQTAIQTSFTKAFVCQTYIRTARFHSRLVTNYTLDFTRTCAWRPELHCIWIYGLEPASVQLGFKNPTQTTLF